MTAMRRDAVECWFLDVGQGASNIIRLPGNRAIVIDCGPKAFDPVQTLSYLGVDRIVALVVTHNDEDHSGSVTQILTTYAKRIDRVFFLSDRPSKKNPVFLALQAERKLGNLEKEQIIRLETIDSPRFILNEDPLSLAILYPHFMDNELARTPNRTSGVLRLAYGSQSVLYAGDLDLEGWRQLTRDGKKRISCDILTVPHHAGLLTKKGSAAAAHHNWVYDKAIKCAYAIVSVGTGNTPDHPVKCHIDALRGSGATILCTQITHHCCEEDELETLRPGVIGIGDVPGNSSPSEERTSSKRRSKKIACAGTIMAELSANGVRIPRARAHRTAIQDLVRHGYFHPLCQPCEQEPSDDA